MKREQKEAEKNRKENRKELRGFVRKHRDSFLRNKFAAMGNSVEGQNLYGWI